MELLKDRWRIDAVPAYLRDQQLTVFETPELCMAWVDARVEEIKAGWASGRGGAARAAVKVALEGKGPKPTKTEAEAMEDVFKTL
jgi:hypothetical protein